MSFLCYHGSVRKNKGMRGNTEIDVVIRRRIRTCYLCFTHPPTFAVSLVISKVRKRRWANERSASGGNYLSTFSCLSYKAPHEFSRSIVYRCVARTCPPWHLPFLHSVQVPRKSSHSAAYHRAINFPTVIKSSLRKQIIVRVVEQR